VCLDLLKHKAQPEAASGGVEAWVQSEREMRERLKREKEAREVREKALVCVHLFILISSSNNSSLAREA